jgi:transcriptional regulator with XRE-family HTH domain
MLAGISAEYYLRLERGRANNPSPQVLDALARVLQLDPKATRYLHELARPNGVAQRSSRLEVLGEAGSAGRLGDPEGAASRLSHFGGSPCTGRRVGYPERSAT